MRTLMVALAGLGAMAVDSSAASRDGLEWRTDIEGAFTDISETGTPLGLDDDDDTAVTSTVGNGLFSSGRVVVGQNGGIAFGYPASDTLQTNNAACIPSARAFGGDQALLAFWDDPGNDFGEIYYEEVGGVAIYQWDNVQAGSASTTFRVQIKVFPTSGSSPGYAQLIFDDVEQASIDGGAIATIGYQDSEADLCVQWSCNDEDAVEDGMVLTLVDQ